MIFNLISDTINITQCIPDILKIAVVDNQQQPFIRQEYLVLIGVVLGAVISIIGNIVLANIQARIQIRNTFFQKRLEIYSKLAEMSYEGYSVINRNNKDEKGDYPKAYDSYEKLKNWLNSMVEIIDKNRFFIDQNTYNQFNKLNWKLLEHVWEIKQIDDIDLRDKKTRLIGRKNVNDIQILTENFVEASRIYMKKTYKLDIEKAI